MKITQAFYDVAAGQMEIVAHELHVTVKINGALALKVEKEILRQDQHVSGIWTGAKSVEKQARETGTKNWAYDFAKELGRFA